MGDFEIHNADCYSVLPEIEQSSVDLVIADPPYGTTQIEWDEEHPPLERLWDLLYGIGKEDCVFVFYSAQPFTTDLIQSNRKDWRYEIIWRKTMGTGFYRANDRPLAGHENLEVFVRAGHVKESTYNPQKWESEPYEFTHGFNPSQYADASDLQMRRSSNGKRHPLTVVTFKNGDNQDNPHPSAKPLALMRWLVRTYTNEGDTVLAPFCGSGRAGIAAIKEVRNFIGIEKDERHATDAERRCRATYASPSLFAEVPPF